MSDKCKHTKYVPLHGHSSFSLGDGITTLDDIIKRAQELNIDAIGLTEHGNMTSFMGFYKKAKASNIKPIIGCELYHNDSYFTNPEEFLAAKRAPRKKANATDEQNEAMDKSEAEETDSSEDEYGDLTSNYKNNHFLTYATNFDGLKNIIHLSNLGFENFYRKPLISTDMILSHLDKNNIITTGCIQSKFNNYILQGRDEEAVSLIKKFKDVFEDNLYLEIQLNNIQEQHKTNHFYKIISQVMNIKPVLALDYHYAWEDDWYIQYLLYVIKSKNSINTLTPDQWFYNVRDLYIKDIDTIYDSALKQGYDMEFLEQAIDSTFEIRDKVDIDIPMYKNNYPEFIQVNNKTSYDIFIETLDRKWNEKLANRLIPEDMVDEYKERLDYELSIVVEKGYIDYFLILNDLLENFVYKVGGSTGAGRGSAGGSLLLFVLDITKIDPIRFGLIFERFMNPARCLPGNYLVSVGNSYVKISDLQLSDFVKCEFSNQPPREIVKSYHKKAIKLVVEEEEVICSINHIWPIIRDGQKIMVKAIDIIEGDIIISY